MEEPSPTRRRFLSGVALGTGLLLEGCNRVGSSGESAAAPDSAPTGPADITLRIGPVLVDIAKDHTISTIGYNGSVPVQLIRLREGVPVTVDLFNDTDTPELVHWHGQIIPANVDGADEERSLATPAHGHLRYRLTPAAGRGSLGPLARDVDVGFESRNLHWSVRFRLYRTQEQSGAVRSGSLPGDARMGALSTPQRRWRKSRTPNNARGGRRRRRMKSPTDGRSGISASPLTANALASASRFASSQDSASCFTS